MEAKTAQAVKGGLTPLWVAKLGNGLCSAVSSGDLLAAATADGVAFLNSADGAVTSKCDDDGLDDVPNVLAFASKGHVIHCGDDGCVRVVSVAGALVQTHEIKEPAAEGKRPRTAPIDHAVAVSGAAFAAAAGRVVHACRMTEASAKEWAPFALELQRVLEAPVRAMSHRSTVPSVAAAASHCPAGERDFSSRSDERRPTTSPAPFVTSWTNELKAIAYAHDSSPGGAAHIARTGDVICSECSSVPSGALHAWTTLPAAAT